MSDKTSCSCHSCHGTSSKSVAAYLPLVFLVTVFFFLPYGRDSDALASLSVIFVSIILEAIPFMLIGSLVGGCIEVFISRERMGTLLPQKSWLTVCIAAGAGIIFPVCECAVVPVVRRLTGKGLPLAAAIAYLLGGPIVNPIVFASTALAYSFNWDMVFLRLGLGYGIAVVIGLLMGRFFSTSEAMKLSPLKVNSSHCDCHSLQNQQTEHTLQTIQDKSCCSDSQPLTWPEKFGTALIHAMDDFLTVGHYLVIGAFIAALAQTYIGRADYLALTTAPVLSVLLMMSLAVFLNLCSEADAFIAASFQGLAPMSAQLAFLLIGPMFDLKLLLMYQEVFTKKTIVTLAALIIGIVFSISIALTFLDGGILL